MPLGNPVTDPELLARIQAKLAQQKLAVVETRKPPEVSTPRGIARSLAQGATAGFGDELTGALVAGAAKLTGDPRPYGDIRRDVTEAERYGLKQFEESNPGTAIASEIAGAVPSSMLGGRMLVQGVPKLAQTVSANVPAWLRVTGSGAAGGAAFGAGKAEEDTVDNALSGALTGAVTGSIGHAVINGIGGRGAALLMRKINNSPKSQAKRLVKQAMLDSGFTREQAEAELERLGPDAILADLGGQVRNLARTAQSMPTGPARAQAEQFLNARDVRQQSQLWEMTQKLTGSKGDAVATLKGLESAQRNAAKPLYDEAYKTSINPTPALKDAFEVDAVRNAYKKGIQLVQNETGRKLKIDTKKLPTDTRSWDWIQRGLRADAAQNLRTGKAEIARTQFMLRDRILSEIDGQNPAFARARSTYAQSEGLKEALEMGQKVLREDAEVLDDYLGSLTESERQAFTVGVTKAIKNELLRPAETRDITRIPLFQSPLVRERVGMALGEDRASKLLDTAKNLAEMRQTKNTLMVRSPTADLLSGQGNAQAGSLVGGMAQAATGDVLGGIRQAAGAFRPQRTLRPDVATQLTDMLLRPNPNLGETPLAAARNRLFGPQLPASPLPGVPFVSGGVGNSIWNY